MRPAQILCHVAAFATLHFAHSTLIGGRARKNCGSRGNSRRRFHLAPDTRKAIPVAPAGACSGPNGLQSRHSKFQIAPMFSAPLSLTPETAYELPSHFYEAGRGNPWVEANLHGLDVHSFIQGPCFDSAGNLWLVDAPFGRVFRIAGNGEWELIVRYDGWPGGFAFHGDGRLILADARHGLLALDTGTRRIAPFLTHQLSQRFRGVAALLFARNGDLYFSDAGQSGLHDPSGCVYRFDSGGSLQRLLDNVPGPAGLALNHDESVLFIAVSRDNAIWRAPLVESGVSRVGKFLQLNGGSGPEGLAIDSDNNLFVAQTRLGRVWQFDKRGEPQYRIDSSRGDTTAALALDPNDPRTLFITDAQTGSVLKAMLPLY